MNREYTYDPEPGNDFTYDEHGNVIYGIGHVGAPRLPMRQYGLSVEDFMHEYLQIDKISRLLFVNNSNDYLNDDYKILQTILTIYEKDENKNKLRENLKKFMRYCLPQERHISNLQLKYFRDVIKLI